MNSKVKNIDIYYIEYVTDYLKDPNIYILNPLHLIFTKVN